MYCNCDHYSNLCQSTSLLTLKQSRFSLPLIMPIQPFHIKALGFASPTSGLFLNCLTRTPVSVCHLVQIVDVQIAAGRTVTEVEVDDFLTGQRSAQEGFVEPSFPTIAGNTLQPCIFPGRGFN